MHVSVGWGLLGNHIVKMSLESALSLLQVLNVHFARLILWCICPFILKKQIWMQSQASERKATLYFGLFSFFALN